MACHNFSLPFIRGSVEYAGSTRQGQAEAEVWGSLFKPGTSSEIFLVIKHALH